MILSRKMTVLLSETEAFAVNSFCKSAQTLWNTANRERLKSTKIRITCERQMYDNKNTLAFKSLPFSTAKLVFQQLDTAWNVYNTSLKNTNGKSRVKPPKNKEDKAHVAINDTDISHELGSSIVKISVPLPVRRALQKRGADIESIRLCNDFFKDKTIKSIQLYPPKDGVCNVIANYEVKSAEHQKPNGHYLSISLSRRNLCTCYDNKGKTFIIGRKYASIVHYYDTEIKRLLTVNSGVVSKRVKQLQSKKDNMTKDYLHKTTKYIADYCVQNKINTVLLGQVADNTLAAVPSEYIYDMLKYKLTRGGIFLVGIKNGKLIRKNSVADKKQGLYIVGTHIFNTDAVRAYNLLERYSSTLKFEIEMPLSGLSNPTVIHI